MRKRVHVKLAMYKTVQEVLSANGPAWEGIPAMVSTIETFSLKLSKLNELAIDQGLVTLGTKSNKDRQKAETVELAERISGALKSFATTTGNLELRETIWFSPSVLKGSRNSKTMIFLDTILMKGFEHLSALQSYGITESDLQLLQAKRNELNISFVSTRAAIINRKGITEGIENLVKEIDFLLLNGLDPQMIVVRKDHAEFYQKYRFSRMIIDSGSKVNSVDPPTEPDEGE